jgi:hypothetical protein
MRGGFGCPASVSPSSSTRKLGRHAGLSRFRSHAMTEPSPITPTAAAALTDRNVQYGEHDRRNGELRPGNKTAVFDALAAAGLTVVVVTFDGYGDSGQIENIEAKIGNEIVVLPSGEIEIAAAVWDHAEPERTVMSVHDAIERLAYDFLQDTHDGWENSDGAYGDFIFDVAERSITLDYNERHMESDFSRHSF